MRIIFLLLLSVFNAVMFHWIGQDPGWRLLEPGVWESDAFREMNLGPAAAETCSLDYENLAVLMLENDFDLTGIRSEKKLDPDRTLPDVSAIIPWKTDVFNRLADAYRVILSDLRYFPVPASSRPDTPDVAYEDSWQQARTYGGERGHEGCDIMGTERERGFYPVVSASDGVVEKIGWLEQGGWRIGIRSPSGDYLYYAHLYSYADVMEEGTPVKAWQLLGFMGDSGYGKEENTVGNFAVHLHFGIYFATENYDELSVNPYWILKRLEKHRQIFDY